MKQQRRSNLASTWLRRSLGLLLSGGMLVGPGAQVAGAVAVGDTRIVNQDLGTQRVVVYPDLIQSYDARTGVITMTQKRDTIRDGQKLTQQYQLVSYQETLQTIDAFTPSTTGIPKVGDAYKGGKVTSVQTSHDDVNHKTMVSVSYDVTQTLTGFPKVGDPFNGGTVTAVTPNSTTQDVYTPSTAGIPKQGDAYGGGTVTSVTTTHDDVNNQTTATVKYDTTQTVPSRIISAGCAQTGRGTGIYTTTITYIGPDGITYIRSANAENGSALNAPTTTTALSLAQLVPDNCVSTIVASLPAGTKTTSNTTTITVADTKTTETIASSATVTYDVTKDVYMPNTAGIPKQGDSYGGGTVTSVTTTYDDVKHQNVATVKYDTTSVQDKTKTISVMPLYNKKYLGQDAYNLTYKGQCNVTIDGVTTTVNGPTTADYVSSLKFDGKTVAVPAYVVRIQGGYCDVWNIPSSPTPCTVSIPTSTTTSNTTTVTVADAKTTQITPNTTTVTADSPTTVSNTNIFKVADTKGTKQVTVATPQYGWATISTDPTSTTTTDYVGAGSMVVANQKTLSPTSSKGGASSFLSDRGRGGVLGGTKMRTLLGANNAVASQAKAQAPGNGVHAKNFGTLAPWVLPASTPAKNPHAEATPSLHAPGHTHAGSK